MGLIFATDVSLNVHHVARVKIQGQSNDNGTNNRIKIVLELDNDGEDIEVTCFGSGAKMPILEVVENWEEGRDDLSMVCFGVGDEMPRLEVVETWEMNPPVAEIKAD